MQQDRYELPLTTESDLAASAYRAGIDCILSAWTGASEALDQAIAADPDFGLAYIARARLHQSYAENTKARAMASRARELAAGATRRERQHVEVLAAAVEGRPAEAIAGAENHLEEFPRDALVLASLLGAYGLYAFSGRADHDAARVAICERHARHYGEDWWFLTYLGWSHSEAGNLKHGRFLTERALGLRRQNAHGAHALAHVLFEQGDTSAANSFLGEWLPAYDRRGMLNGHLSWHEALLALESGDTDRALAIYETRIRPIVSAAAPMHVFADGTSLMWRLCLEQKSGLESHWRELANYGEQAFPRAGGHFVDFHYALAAAATENRQALDHRLEELANLHAAGKLVPGDVLIALYRGIQSFAQGNYENAIAVLEPRLADFVRIGGSHAQRELYEDTLIVACLRAGQPRKARGFIDSRLHRRPSRRDEAWRSQTS
jgi:Tfp pilus assembly protein PilF